MNRLDGLMCLMKEFEDDNIIFGLRFLSWLVDLRYMVADKIRNSNCL